MKDAAVIGRPRTWIVGFFCAAVLLAIYGATLAPSLTWAHYGADGGDLATAVTLGRLPHPPGFPTYLLLGTLFVRLPWRDPAWRLNLMSAAAAAGAAALIAAAAWRLAGDEKGARDSGFGGGHAALCAGLCLGLAPLFWSQAVIAEVYALAALFSALTTALALYHGPAWALGLSWGLGLGVHPTLLFLAPVVWAGTAGEKRARRLAQAGLCAMLGCGLMYGPALLAWSRAPSPWGNVSTLAGWWTLVSGRLYRGYLFALPLADYPRRLLAWAGLLIRQFTPLGAALAGWGWARLWRTRRALATALALSLAVFSFYAIGYNTTDSLVYLTPALALPALCLAAGLAQAARWLNRRLRRGVWLLLLLPLLQGTLFWGQMDLSDDREATVWAKQTLQGAPPQAVIVTAQDAYTFALWYAHEALGERPDVTVLDRDLWGWEAYRVRMAEALGLDAAVGLSPEEAARQAGRPVVYAGE